MTNQATQIPTTRDESLRQRVEQFRMGRPLALATKVFHIPAQARAKKQLPQTVDRDSGGQWILRAYQPARQIQPVCPRSTRLKRRQIGWRARSNHLTRFIHPVASFQYPNHPWIDSLGHQSCGQTGLKFVFGFARDIQLFELRITP